MPTLSKSCARPCAKHPLRGTGHQLVVDHQPYIYSEEDLRAVKDEATRAGRRVCAHAMTDGGARNAVAAGLHSIELLSARGGEMGMVRLAGSRGRGAIASSRSRALLSSSSLSSVYRPSTLIVHKIRPLAGDGDIRVFREPDASS